MRLRLAYFSPLPPAATGIADYSRALLPHLAELADVTLFAPDPAGVDVRLLPSLPLHPLAGYASRRWQFDLPLYQMGNSSHHDPFYSHFLAFPGVVVLHEYGLHQFMAQRTIGQDRPGEYSRAVGLALGPAGLDLAAATIHGGAPPLWYHSPLNDQILARGLGLIVHSRFVAQQLAGQGYARETAVVPALIDAHPPYQGRPPGWPFPDGAIVFASAGQVTGSKQIDRALRAFARLRQERGDVYYLIVGEPLPGEIDLSALLAELELDDAVHTTGFVPDLASFAGWIAAADAVVNLRYPTAGETSATALRGMAAGRPVVVYDHGWYAELPGDAVLRLPPLDDDALLDGLRRLAAAPDWRRDLGRRAARHVSAQHDPAQIAREYDTALAAIHRRVLEPLRA